MNTELQAIFLFKDDEFAASLLNNAIEENAIAPDTQQESCELFMAPPNTTCFESKSQHIWQHDETKALINSMQTHLEDLKHPKKRKHVFDNVANDLISQGINVTGVQCQVKWKSLIRSYHSAKDNQKKTGRKPSRFQFFEEMDATLGNKSSNKINFFFCSCLRKKIYLLNVGFRLKTIKPL